MMEEIKKLLADELQEEFSIIRTVEPGTDAHKVMTDSICKYVDKQIEIEKLEGDKANERKKLISDNVDKVVKNTLTAASIFGGMYLTYWGTKVTLEFDKTGNIITSIAGKIFTKNLFPKK